MISREHPSAHCPPPHLRSPCTPSANPNSGLPKRLVTRRADDLKELVTAYKGVYSKKGLRFPEDPWEQLQRAVAAVFESWMVPR